MFMMFYVYVLRCKDGTLYTGYTNDIKKRFAQHNDGKGAKYTRSRRPVKLIKSWSFATKTEALRAEHAFKKLPRKEKLRRLE